MPVAQRSHETRKDDGHPPGIGRVGTRLLELSENVIYGGIAAFLVGTALVCLALAGKTAWGLTTDFSEQPVLDLLDFLLLVFIVVELLFAVRSTVEKRELVAEPFLLVGHHRLDQGDRRALGRGGRRRWATVPSSTTGSPRSPCSACWCCCWA